MINKDFLISLYVKQWIFTKYNNFKTKKFRHIEINLSENCIKLISVY